MKRILILASLLLSGNALSIDVANVSGLQAKSLQKALELLGGEVTESDLTFDGALGGKRKNVSLDNVKIVTDIIGGYFTPAEVSIEGQERVIYLRSGLASGAQRMIDRLDFTVTDYRIEGELPSQLVSGVASKISCRSDLYIERNEDFIEVDVHICYVYK